MEYTPLESTQHYSDCAPLIEGLGYALVELRIGHTKSSYQVRAVISRLKVEDGGIGIDDCSKVHTLLFARLEAVFGTQDIHMEVTSPGTERQIKNAAEFPLFVGRMARVWYTEVQDWIAGKILGADSTKVTLEIDGAERSFPFEQIAKAKLVNS